VFREVGSAITHSRFAVDVVRRIMGVEFPMLSCPSPVWDRFQPLPLQRDPLAAARLTLPSGAFAIDSGDLRGAEIVPAGASASLAVDLEALLEDADGAQRDPAMLRLEGVVYTSVFNPADFRKNWQRMVTTFCRAFRETPDAVLLLKFVHWNHGYYLPLLSDTLYKIAPFRCRVVAIGGFLDGPTYDEMVRATTYVVAASTGEGQCLPLMEFLSCGKPAITPHHTAMLDYVDEDDAFLVEACAAEASFPQDPRGKLLTSAFQFEPDSMVRALLESYATAKEHPERYRRLSENAVLRLGEHCSRRVTRERLRSFLQPSSVPVTARGIE
jgi:glycosyltransferase involved in cell wall biosynthesis